MQVEFLWATIAVLPEVLHILSVTVKNLLISCYDKQKAWADCQLLWGVVISTVSSNQSTAFAVE